MNQPHVILKDVITPVITVSYKAIQIQGRTRWRAVTLFITSQFSDEWYKWKMRKIENPDYKNRDIFIYFLSVWWVYVIFQVIWTPFQAWILITQQKSWAMLPWINRRESSGREPWSGRKSQRQKDRPRLCQMHVSLGLWRVMCHWHPQTLMCKFILNIFSNCTVVWKLFIP